jgi:hypothetical protein
MHSQFFPVYYKSSGIAQSQWLYFVDECDAVVSVVVTEYASPPDALPTIKIDNNVDFESMSFAHLAPCTAAEFTAKYQAALSLGVTPQ